MKHKLKNIANRPIPVDGTDLNPMPGEIVEAEITNKLKYMIKNKFFEDLGIVEEKAKPIEDYIPEKPRKKKGKKISKKKKEVKSSEEY